jgi:hypothetical protein
MAESLIKFETGAHWYDREGTPQHDADLRVARKQKLYPSPTSIDKDEFKNDFLDRWKMNQLVIAACDNPKNEGESDKDYAQRIYEISLTKSKTASEFGKRVHKAIEAYPNLPSAELLKHFTNFQRWYEANIRTIHASERVVVDNDIAVAGTADFVGEGLGFIDGRVVVDYKTQDVKVDDKGRKKPAFYDSWARQLSFYAVCDAKETGLFPALPHCVSLIIDSNPEAEVYHKLWTPEEIKSAYEDFVIAAYRWFKRKSYWPHPNGPFSVSLSVQMP